MTELFISIKASRSLISQKCAFDHSVKSHNLKVSISNKSWVLGECKYKKIH